MAPRRIVLKGLNNEGGFVLVGALLILLLLVLIGISASTSTMLELQIAASDRTHKETFYQADAGTQLAIRLVEESLAAPGGFTAVDADGVLIHPFNPNNTLLIVNPAVALNDGVSAEPTDAARDAAYFPEGYDPTNAAPHTNLTAAGVTGVTEGSGLQMVAGYEGKGKGATGGGTNILYTIYSQHVGNAASESVIKVEWRHVIGLELESRY